MRWLDVSKVREIRGHFGLKRRLIRLIRVRGLFGLKSGVNIYR